jgi:hypothetical protein
MERRKSSFGAANPEGVPADVPSLGSGLTTPPRTEADKTIYPRSASTPPRTAIGAEGFPVLVPPTSSTTSKPYQRGFVVPHAPLPPTSAPSVFQRFSNPLDIDDSIHALRPTLAQRILDENDPFSHG